MRNYLKIGIQLLEAEGNALIPRWPYYIHTENTQRSSPPRHPPHYLLVDILARSIHSCFIPPFSPLPSPPWQQHRCGLAAAQVRGDDGTGAGWRWHRCGVMTVPVRGDNGTGEGWRRHWSGVTKFSTKKNQHFWQSLKRHIVGSLKPSAGARKSRP